MKLPVYYATSFNGIILKGGHSKPWYEGSFLFAPQIPIDKANEIIPTDTLYAFDYFICNRDRTQRKPNLLIKEGQGVLIDHEMALEINEQTISNFNERKWDNRYKYHLFHSALKNNVPTEKNDYFNEFEFYLQSLNINKYNEIFQQLKELGFTDLKENLIKEYLTLVIRNPKKFITILKDSIT